MTSETITFPGFISLTIYDQVQQRVLGLGMRGYQDLDHMDQEFAELRTVAEGTSAFTAKKILAGRVVQEKPVPAELVEGLFRTSVGELIQKARRISLEDTPELSVAMGLTCRA